MNGLITSISALSDVLTIFASGIAIKVYWKNRDRIGAALKLLLNFSFRTSLTEISQKIERLNEYNAAEPEDVDEIRNILHEIAGQIRGSIRLSEAFPELVARIEKLADHKVLKEPQKRSLVSQMREALRSAEIGTLNDQSAGDVK